MKRALRTYGRFVAAIAFLAVARRRSRAPTSSSTSA